MQATQANRQAEQSSESRAEQGSTSMCEGKQCGAALKQTQAATCNRHWQVQTGKQERKQYSGQARGIDGC